MSMLNLPIKIVMRENCMKNLSGYS